MNTVSFTNDGEIDIRALSHFGLHAKQSDDAIGYFGTGLKYALAVLMRTGHTVDIWSGDAHHHVFCAPDEFRGKAMEFVRLRCPNGALHDLGFTTELAKNWEVWAAYRELACNCTDEGGSILDRPVTPAPGTTVITVRGDEFYAAYLDRASIILESTPLAHIQSGPSPKYDLAAELHDGPSSDVYYKGIKAMQLEHASLYRYNLTSQRELTEDRTLKHSPASAIGQAYLMCTDEKLLERVLLAPRDTFEGRLDLDWPGRSVSDVFLYTVERLEKEHAVDVNQSAVRAYHRITERVFAPTAAALSAVERSKVERALDFVERHGYDARRYPMHCVESLGRGILAMAHDGAIYLTRQLVNTGGATKLASALIEEYLHLRHGFADESREMQTFLFEKIVSLYEEIDGEAL